MLHNVVVCNRLKYRDVVKGIVETSMQDAIENVKALPDYVDKGEVLVVPGFYGLFMHHSHHISGL